MKAGKSNIEIVARADHAITIRDVGPWTRFMTITNDAEGVVAELWKLGLLKSHQRLFYYDSADELDELLHQDGAFTGFKPGPAAGPYGDLEEPEVLDDHWHPHHDDRDSDDRVDYDRERQALDDREQHE